jgi:ribosomal protein L32
MVEAIKSLSKGAEMMIHQGVLMRQQVSELQEANKAATRRKSHKRKRVQKEGTLTVEDGVRLTTLKEFGARSNGKKAKKRAHVEVGEPSQRRCGRCGETGHNARTCRQEAAINSE